jgi:protein gp37
MNTSIEYFNTPANDMSKHNTDIEWLHWPGYIAETLNPTTGCGPKSEGCLHCYAARLAASTLSATPRYYDLAKVNHHGHAVYKNIIRTWPETLEKLVRWTKPRCVFINSMGDLFHPRVPAKFIQKTLGYMGAARPHAYVILTKWPERAVKVLEGLESCRGPNDVFYPVPQRRMLIGPSIENQERAEERLPYVKQLHEMGYQTVVSFEPLLSSIYFDVLSSRNARDGSNMIDWALIGGESGEDDPRPFQISWAFGLISQLKERGVPAYMKQLGANPRYRGKYYPTRHFRGAEPNEWPPEIQCRELPPLARRFEPPPKLF